MMTRQHFNAIAATLAEELEDNARMLLEGEITESTRKASDETIIALADNLADALAPFNPHFDRERFVKACLGE